MQIKTDLVVTDCIENPRAHRAIFEKEGELTIKNLVGMEDRMQAYRLRNNIFCKELGWALQTENGLEIDEHDEEATFLGVVNKDGRLLACLRIILADRRFMIEKEFLSLVSSSYIVKKKYDTIEVSRLCVAPESRKDKISGNFGMHYISMLLYKGLYQWCIKNDKRHLYAVTEMKIYKLLCSIGFPCKLIGDLSKMPDGIVAVAFIIDLREWETIQITRRPKMLKWFSSTGAHPDAQENEKGTNCVYRIRQHARQHK